MRPSTSLESIRDFRAVDCKASGSEDRLELSPIVFGAATFGASYHLEDGDEYFASDLPRQALTRAFEAGINAIDTSPFYTTSEQVLGRIFADPTFRDRFPRSSYHLITKAGRYGTKRDAFDYSAKRIRESVAASCRQMHTDYLDVVYLHDVEFVAEDIGNANDAGYPLKQLKHLETYGLSGDEQDVIHGPGDEQILEGARTLFELRDAGVVRRVGIAGYPLLTLLRLARLIASPRGCGRPLDILQSYSHHTLHNDALPTFIPLFLDAGVRQVVNASPLSMGLFSPKPPSWHPASKGLKSAVETAAERCSIANVALGFGLSSCGEGRAWTPTVVGFSTPTEVDAALDVYRQLGSDGLKRRLAGEDLTDERRVQDEQMVTDEIERAGCRNWSWPSPPASKEAKVFVTTHSEPRHRS